MKKPYYESNNTRYYDCNETLIFLENFGKIKYGSHFKIHQKDRFIIFKMIIHAIQDDESCLKHYIDPKKGILLIGPVGCGKTTLMNLVREFCYDHNHYLIKSVRDIALEYSEDGHKALKKYSKQLKIYCFDDLGVEQNLKHFGNTCNTIGEILLDRYELLIKFNVLTHATTNLNAQELESLYGNRVRSRMRSMFNVLTFSKSEPDKR
jgi:DNA replication protein DnaC